MQTPRRPSKRPQTTAHIPIGYHLAQRRALLRNCDHVLRRIKLDFGQFTYFTFRKRICNYFISCGYIDVKGISCIEQAGACERSMDVRRIRRIRRIRGGVGPERSAGLVARFGGGGGGGDGGGGGPPEPDVSARVPDVVLCVLS